jgi:hypothetical protein
LDEHGDPSLIIAVGVHSTDVASFDFLAAFGGDGGVGRVEVVGSCEVASVNLLPTDVLHVSADDLTKKIQILWVLHIIEIPIKVHLRIRSKHPTNQLPESPTEVLAPTMVFFERRSEVWQHLWVGPLIGSVEDSFP